LKRFLKTYKIIESIENNNKLRQRDFLTWCPWRAPSTLRNHLWYYFMVMELFHYFQKVFFYSHH